MLKIISSTQLTDYINTYKQTLLRGIEALSSDYQSLFEFQKEQPMRITGFISDSHGAAVVFSPSKEEIIQIKQIKNRIEDIFPKDPLTGNTLLQTELKKGLNTFSERIYKITANLDIKCPFLQKKNELVILQKGCNLFIGEQGSYTIKDRLILKGSNSVEKWTKEQAKINALYALAYPFSQEALDKTQSKLDKLLSIAEEIDQKTDKIEEIDQTTNKLLSIAEETKQKIDHKDIVEVKLPLGVVSLDLKEAVKRAIKKSKDK